MHTARMSKLATIIPQLFAILDIFLSKAMAPRITLPARTQLTRTICRLTRLIMTLQVWVYQHRIKTAMLADKEWRERVIDELGGYMALYAWQRRFNAGPQHADTRPHQTDPQSPPEPVSRIAKIPSRQFCLAPMPRDFYGYGRGRARDFFKIHEPVPAVSGFDKPIPLEPWELISRALLRRYGFNRPKPQNRQYAQTSPRPPRPVPP